MDPKLEMLIMAQQHFVERMSYNEIAQLHGVSVATVSRRLTDAKDQGFVEEVRRVKPPSKDYEEQLYRHVTFERIGGRLLDALNQRGAGLRRVVVCAGDADPADESSFAEEKQRSFPRLNRVGCHGARLLAQHLHSLRESKQGIRIGVNWGYSVQYVCKHLRKWADEELLAADDVVLSGLAGLFWFDCERDLALARRSWEVSAAANAQLLASCFDREEEMPVYLIRVPAFLSAELCRQEEGRLAATRDVLQDFCRSDPGYHTVYGDKPILPDAAEAEAYLAGRWENRARSQERYGNIVSHDILLTGMSALEGGSSIVNFSAPELRAKIEVFRTQYGACGDIASHIFTENGTIPRKDDSTCPEIGAINSRVLSLWPEDLAQVAERHREQGAAHGGTILVSAGQHKAKALTLALTKLQVANDIVIDTNLAWKMYEFLGMEKERKEDFATAHLWDSTGTETS